MGYELSRYEITGRLSRHNSPKDHAHNQLWDEMVSEVEQILNHPKYADIYLNGWGEIYGELSARYASDE